MLKVELEDLKFSNFDLDLVGFGTEELDEIMNQDQISAIYAALDLKLMRENAIRLLHDFNRDENYPHSQRARIAVCPVCGQEFRAVKEYKGKKAVYCSKECWSRRASHEKVCPICGEKFKSSYSQNKKYCSLECRNKAYKDRTGELSNFWEGGKTAKKKLLRTCADYKAWRLAVFKRDNFICQKCGKHSTDLEAHHLKEVCNYPEQIFDVDNGVTLCHQCHKETDNYGNKARELKITHKGE